MVPLTVDLLLLAVQVVGPVEGDVPALGLQLLAPLLALAGVLSLEVLLQLEIRVRGRRSPVPFQDGRKGELVTELPLWFKCGSVDFSCTEGTTEVKREWFLVTC